MWLQQSWLWWHNQRLSGLSFAGPVPVCSANEAELHAPWRGVQEMGKLSPHGGVYFGRGFYGSHRLGKMRFMSLEAVRHS